MFNKTILTILTALACVLAQAETPKATAPTLSPKQMDAIHQRLEDMFEQQRFVGFQAAVFDQKQISSELNLGYADLEHKVPVSSDTRFEIASITKSFTGLALLQLEEAGTIDLDAPIQTTVPDFPAKKAGKITPRILSGSMSGIRHYNDTERTPAYYATHFHDVSKALVHFKDDPLLFAPGEAIAYTSYGYNLLAAAIQGASGEVFQDYVRRTILSPLGLKDTGYIDVRLPLERRSRHYSYIDPMSREVLDHLSVLPTLDHSYNMGGGNMYSSARDLAVFGGQFLAPGFLSESVFKSIYETHFTQDNKPSYFSDGWLMTGLAAEQRFLVIGGSYPGTLSQLLVFPDYGVAVAWVSNTWGKDGGHSFSPKGSFMSFATGLGKILAASQ